MHTVNIHIDETIGRQDMGMLYKELMSSPHVKNVELREAQPHDVMVEFDEHHNMPMQLLGMLQQHGFHADIVGC